MERLKLLERLADSLRQPLMFVDTDHIIRYLNKAASQRYKVPTTYIDRSIFDCHNEKSCGIIRDAFEKLQAGAEEVRIGEDEEYLQYMRAVRDEDGTLLGYCPRLAPTTGYHT